MRQGVLKSENWKSVLDKSLSVAEDEVILVGTAGNANKNTIQVVAGKNGISVSTLFSKILFNQSDVRPITEGNFVPLLIVNKKYINPEVLAELGKGETVILE